MSKEYIVISCEEPAAERSVDDMPARIEMRFTDNEASEAFAAAEAKRNPGRRYYSLMGASCWHHCTKVVPPHKCVAGRVGDDMYECQYCGKDMST